MIKSGLLLFLLILCFGYNLNADDLKDLSADAVCEFQKLRGTDETGSQDFNLDEKNSPAKNFILKDNPNAKPDQKYAFLTQKGSRGGGASVPYIIINLAKESLVKKIYIQNRLDEKKTINGGLVVWFSSDKNFWKRIWKAKSAEDEWTIDIPNGEKAKYIMIGLDDYNEVLGLNKIRIYGK